MDRFGTYARVNGTDLDADAERARDARRLRELDAADALDPGIDAGLNLAVDKLLDAVLRREEEDGAAMDLQRPDRFETR
jgi:hypothetical protein